LKVLQDKSINQINFTMGDISVSPSMYENVSKAITDGKITVIVQPDALKPNESGKYFSELPINKDKVFYNVIVLRSTDLGSGVNEQFHRAEAIVHECTHAGFDLLKVPKMTHTQDEAGAYAAQSLFAIAKMLELKGDPEKVKPRERIESAAWDIALLLNKQATSPPLISPRYRVNYWTSPDFAVALWTAWDKLNIAIRNSDEYKATAENIVKHEGVGRPWKLPKQ
jgi:hypothetical protein